ncbi:MAG: GNAT family N-acetyltransferase [Verrucomicrobiota bacterium]
MSAIPSDPAVQRIDPLNDPAWDAGLAAFPGATCFHTAAWARVLRDTYRFQPSYFTTRTADGALSSIVPLMEVNSWLTGRRGLSLPFTDECEPLGIDRETLRTTFRAIVAHAKVRRWKHWELRGNTTALDAPSAVSFHGHRLALSSDSARLLARCDSAVRRAIRKAEQAQLTITFAHDLESTRAFHALLCKTRRRLGVPPQPLRFFENIQRHILSHRKGCIVLARLGDTPIAGAVFLHFGRSALFKFGASDETFQQFRPNNLVMWRAIDWHARNGFDSLDFGRTSLGNEGLRRFKLSWGATERRISYARFDPRAATFVKAPDRSLGWHNGLFRVLPVAIARLLGAAAYKHVA